MRRFAGVMALRRAAMLVVGGLAVGAAATAADALTVSWNNASGGNWTGSNWTGGGGSGPPGSGDTANFALANTYNVNLDISPTVNNCTVAGSNVTFTNSTAGRTFTWTTGGNVNSGSLTLNASQPINLIANNNCGFNTNVSILNGSDFNGTNVSIGVANSGSMVVDGVGSSMTLSANMSIGQGIGKIGTLILQNGANVSTGGTVMATLNSGQGNLDVDSGADYSTLGLTMSNNAVLSQVSVTNVDGSGSSLTNTGNLSIGSSGTNLATLTVSNSALFQQQGAGQVSLGSSGLIDVESGGLFSVSQFVGVGSGSGNQGRIVVNGTSSSFSQTGNVGVSLGAATGSTATIQVGTGANFSTGTAGMTVNATGQVSINGGSFNLNGDGAVDGGSVSRASGASFTVAAGKTMTVKNAGHFTVTGTYTMNTTGQITVTGTGSAMHVDTSTLTIGGGGAVNIASDAIVSAFEERVGDASGGSVVQSGGSHTISIDGGAGTSLNPLWIAPSVGSTGSYTLSGGTLTVFNNAVGANGESVGFSGAGTFTQTGGDHIVAGANGNLVIGFAPTGVGSYTITNGNLTAHSLYLGRDGGAQGSLTVNAGSNVNVDQEFIDVALNAPASATVTVNGGLVDCYGMFVGGKSTVGGGAGVLSVNGGTVIVSPQTGLTNSGQLRVWDTSGSGVTLASGAIACDTLLTSGNPSRFNWTGGELQVTGAGGFAVSATGPLGAGLALGNNMTLWIDNRTTIAAGASIAVTGTGAFITGSLAGAGALSSDGSFMFTGMDNTSSTFTGTITGAGGLSKTGTGKLTVANTRIASLAIHNGGTLAVIPTGGAASGTSTLSALTIDGGSKFDIGDNKVIARSLASGSSWNGTHYAGIAGMIESGYHGGDFLGSGIVTTQSSATGGNTLTNIGFASAADTGYAGGSFGGISVAGGDLLVMYTYGGDANLDGIVNGDDYFQIDSGFPQGLHGWFNGDFNYDGLINGDDYFVIDSNFPAQGAAFPTGGGSVAATSLTAVPEPIALAPFVLLALSLGRARRGRKGEPRHA